MPYKGPVNPPYGGYYMDPALTPSMHGTSALRCPLVHPAPVQIDPPLPTATYTQTKTDSVAEFLRLRALQQHSTKLPPPTPHPSPQQRRSPGR